MTDAVSPKLLVVLAATIALAAFAALRLSSGDDVLGDVGFDQIEDAPLAESEATQEATPLVEEASSSSRNPFERGDAASGAGPTPAVTGSSETAPSEVEDPATTSTTTTPTTPAAANSFDDTPFPDPALIDAEPGESEGGRGDARADTSFNG